jgi:hypothetical protein
MSEWIIFIVSPPLLDNPKALLAMKKSTIYPYILLLIITAASCGKDSADGNASHKLKSYTEDITAMGIGHVVQTYTINYDDRGRITTIESTKKNGPRMVYQYSAENSFTYDKFDDNKLVYHSINFINSQSLIDSTWWCNIQNDTSSSKFIYNEDKKLIKQKQYIIKYILPPVLYNTVSYQYDLKGTLVKESDQGYYETSYAYDKEVKNTVQLQPYSPVKEQLPSHSYTTRLGTTTEIKHTYTFDGNNRVISERAEQNDGRITIMTYTYE